MTVTFDADPRDFKRPFRVLVTDETGDRWTVRVNAWGKHDARNLAIEAARDEGFVRPTVLTIEDAP